MNFICLLMIAASMFLSGCIGLQNKENFSISGVIDCPGIQEDLDQSSPLSQLNSLYPLLKKSCYKQVIQVGQFVQKNLRNKIYSVSKESGEIIVNEGVLKDYVLEEYERVHISYLIAFSFYKLKDFVSAKVELRHANDEALAEIYTSGKEELNLLLIADLWEKLGEPKEASPNYRKIINMTEASPGSLRLAHDRLKLIDENRKSPQYVYAIGDFPNLIYQLGSDFDEEYTLGYPMNSCRSDSGELLTIKPWIGQLSARGHDEVSIYKKTARLPLTLLYSSAVLVAGGYLTVASAHATDGRLAGALAVGTLFLTYRTFSMGFAPDMRYWSELPFAFVFTTRSDFSKEPCGFRYQGVYVNLQRLF